MENILSLCASVLGVAFTVWFLIYVPTCSWHSYQDDLTCKAKSGIYNCELKEHENKHKIEIKEGN